MDVATKERDHIKASCDQRVQRLEEELQRRVTAAEEMRAKQAASTGTIRSQKERLEKLAGECSDAQLKVAALVDQLQKVEGARCTVQMNDVEMVRDYVLFSDA